VGAGTKHEQADDKILSAMEASSDGIPDLALRADVKEVVRMKLLDLVELIDFAVDVLEVLVVDVWILEDLVEVDLVNKVSGIFDLVV
jgi:hypothetical protein